MYSSSAMSTPAAAAREAPTIGEEAAAPTIGEEAAALATGAAAAVVVLTALD